MDTEYKLSYTAEDINARLGKIDNIDKNTDRLDGIHCELYGDSDDNFFNSTAVLDGYFLHINYRHVDGFIQADANKILSGYQPVKEGAKYCIETNESISKIGTIAFFDINKQPICAVYSVDGGGYYGSKSVHWPEIDGFATVNGTRYNTEVEILEGSNIAYMMWYICSPSDTSYAYYGEHTESELETIMSDIKLYVINSPSLVNDVKDIKMLLYGGSNIPIFNASLAMNEKNVQNNPNHSSGYLGSYENSILSGYHAVKENNSYIIKANSSIASIGTVFFFDKNKLPICAINRSGGYYGSESVHWPEIDGFATVNGSAYNKEVEILEGSNIAYMMWYIGNTRGYSDYYGSHTEEDFTKAVAGIELYKVINGSLVDDVANLKNYANGKTLTNGMELIIENDNTIYLRTPYIDDYDLVHYMSKYDGGNGTFRMWHIYRIPHTNSAYDFTTGRANYKITQDDVPPVNFGGTFIGGGHGCDAVRIVNCPSHGKTEADIGSVWLSANGKQYVIVKIVDADNLWIIYNCYGTTSVKNIFSKVAVTSPLTHVSGATNIADITFTETPINGMLTPCAANYSIKVMDFDTEIEGDYRGEVERLSIVEQYDIINPVAVVNHLVDNVGNNTNESYYDTNLNKWLTCNLIYDFSGENSACVITASYITRAAVYGYIMGTQCQSISSSLYLNATVFDTTDYQTIFDMPSESINWDTETWSNENIPTSRVCIYNPDESKSMCIGYEQLSTAKDSVRKDKGGYIWTSQAHKMYPVIASGDFADGEVIQAVCYRIPFEHEDTDACKMYFYKLRDTYYVFIDFYEAYSGVVAMPPQIADGKVVEVVKASNATLGTDVIFDGNIAVHATGFGYLHLKVKG